MRVRILFLLLFIWKTTFSSNEKLPLTFNTLIDKMKTIDHEFAAKTVTKHESTNRNAWSKFASKPDTLKDLQG